MRGMELGRFCRGYAVYWGCFIARGVYVAYRTRCAQRSVQAVSTPSRLKSSWSSIEKTKASIWRNSVTTHTVNSTHFCAKRDYSEKCGTKTLEIVARIDQFISVRCWIAHRACCTDWRGEFTVHQTTVYDWKVCQGAVEESCRWQEQTLWSFDDQYCWQQWNRRVESTSGSELMTTCTLHAGRVISRVSMYVGRYVCLKRQIHKKTVHKNASLTIAWMTL